jgi:glycosyltransferase involved in cell wall biosynthesis
MINISFAITVCNEAFELDRLLNQLDKCVVEGDEVVIQVDKNNTTSEVLEIISSYEGKYNPVISRSKEKIVSPTKVFYSLNNDFAEFKNNIKKHCTNDYIFFIDADEEVTQDQIHLIREILELNSNIDCFLVPRINTVEGLTDEHIKQWGWKVTEDGWINWPDMQFRLCRNTPEIKWEGKVHERLNGYKTISQLPAESILALQHHKTIQKQELQNNFYNAI